MAEQVRACAICGDNKATLHLLPKKEELRKKWLEFIFGTLPAKYNSNLVLCSNHFDHSDFSNFGAYSNGFASRLFIKPGSVPSRRSTASSQTSTLVTPPTHTSTQTDPPSLSCRATLLAMGTLGHPARSKGTQTESFMKSMSISTSTLDAPWGPATSMPVKHVHPRPAKRPRVGEEEEEEEDEGDIFTIKPEPHDSTYDPAQSRSNVTESLQPTDTSSTGYKDSKCIVLEKNLMELFETCPVCSRVSDVRTYKRGTYLSVVQKCNHCQYSKQWKSQPVMAASL